MKNNILVMGFFSLCMTTSCSSTMTDEIEQSSQTANLTFSVKGDEFITTFTRVQADSLLKQLDLALYTLKDSVYTKYASIQSSSTDTGFGTISVPNVAYGTYTVLCVGNASSFGGHVNLDNFKQLSFDQGQVPVTYYVSQTVTVDANSSSIPLELHPACASFKIIMNGALPSGISNLKMEVKQASNYLDGSTGLAPSGKLQDYSRTVTIPTEYVGGKGITARTNIFLPEEDMSSNSGICVSVSALDSDGKVVISYLFEDVPLKRGYITTYTGNFFQNDSQGFAVSVDNEWGVLSETY